MINPDPVWRAAYEHLADHVYAREFAAFADWCHRTSRQEEFPPTGRVVGEYFASQFYGTYRAYKQHRGNRRSAEYVAGDWTKLETLKKKQVALGKCFEALGSKVAVNRLAAHRGEAGEVVRQAQADHEHLSDGRHGLASLDANEVALCEDAKRQVIGLVGSASSFENARAAIVAAMLGIENIHPDRLKTIELVRRGRETIKILEPSSHGAEIWNQDLVEAVEPLLRPRGEIPVALVSEPTTLTDRFAELLDAFYLGRSDSFVSQGFRYRLDIRRLFWALQRVPEPTDQPIDLYVWTSRGVHELLSMQEPLHDLDKLRQRAVFAVRVVFGLSAKEVAEATVRDLSKHFGGPRAEFSSDTARLAIDVVKEWLAQAGVHNPERLFFRPEDPAREYTPRKGTSDYAAFAKRRGVDHTVIGLPERIAAAARWDESRPTADEARRRLKLAVAKGQIWSPKAHQPRSFQPPDEAE